MNKIKQFLKKILPKSFLAWNRRRKLTNLRVRNTKLSTKEVFTSIYAQNVWGGEKGSFCSGSGSQLSVAIPYCEMVKQFVSEHNVKSVLDIGCGDFTVGQQMQVFGTQYIGIDIVQDLIDRNTKLFGSNGIQFKCLDAIVDQLPIADLVLVRQVLQHLSNEQISRLLSKLHAYRYVMVTEHYPAPCENLIPNLDKPHGGDTRIYDGSAVYLDRPPFNIQGLRTILQVPASDLPIDEGETIKTVLFIGHPDPMKVRAYEGDRN